MSDAPEEETKPEEPGPVRMAYSVRETAAKLGVGRTAIWQLMNSGQLPYSMVGGSRRILHEDLVQMLKANARHGRRVDGHARRKAGAA